MSPLNKPLRSLIILPSSRFSHLLELLESSSLELFHCYSSPLGSVGDEIQFELIDPFFRCTEDQLTSQDSMRSLLVFHTLTHRVVLSATVPEDRHRLSPSAIGEICSDEQGPM